MERATQPPPVAEEQNQEAEQLQNLAYVKTQALSLMKTISRVLEEVSAYTETNTTPKWKDILKKYKMINLDLFILVEVLQLVSKDLVVFPKNVNAENASILPVMLSTKLLPEMETDNSVKSEELLQEVQSLPIATQIETLKERIGKIAEACESAEKEMADARKAYGFPPHSGLSMSPFPTKDKVQAAKILDQENMLRGTVNEGKGLRLPPEQREITTALPPHMVAALFDPGNNVASNNINSQEDLMQVSGTQVMESSAASSSGANFDTTGPTRHASPTLGDQMSNSSGMMQTQESQSEQQKQKQQGEGGGGHGNM